MLADPKVDAVVIASGLTLQIDTNRRFDSIYGYTW